MTGVMSMTIMTEAMSMVKLPSKEVFLMTINNKNKRNASVCLELATALHHMVLFFTLGWYGAVSASKIQLKLHNMIVRLFNAMHRLHEAMV